MQKDYFNFKNIGFLEILVDGISVRGAEEVARQVKSEIQQKEPHRKGDKLYIPELDARAKKLVDTEKFSRVLFEQTSKKARAILELKGDPSHTTPWLNNLSDKLAD